ncbi:MAG: multiple sugar transport system permease protein [Thermomicrobiales bacterium]|nr:multiple sugar transport system permease protein [Thermomicrobiales bacterium]MEA2529163.1 multiple sugar transport system permease protein [Thermomicrobiales bacterium]
MRGESPLRRVMLYVAALLVAAFWFGPLLLVGVASLVPDGNLLSFPPRWFDDGIFFGNYEYILTGTLPETYLQPGALRGAISQEVRFVPRSMLNSAIVATGVALTNIVLGSLAAYAFARLRFPGRAAAFNFVLASRLLPAIALAVPYYAIVSRFGLLNSRWALLLIYSVLTLPFTTLILTLNFRAVPEAIDEAAQIEGASPLRVLWDIMLPLALPAVVGVGLFSFMLSYSEFLFALLIMTGSETKTLPVLFGSLSTNRDVAWGLLTASIILGSLPTLVLVAPVWRFMVRGLTAGAER